MSDDEVKMFSHKVWNIPMHQMHLLLRVGLHFTMCLHFAVLVILNWLSGWFLIWTVAAQSAFLLMKFPWLFGSKLSKLVTENLLLLCQCSVIL